MPKSPHDSLALLALVGSLFFSGAFLALAKRRFTQNQQATLSSRGVEPMVVFVGFAGIMGGYYFAPIYPAWAIVGVVLAAGFAAMRIARQHSGQEYTLTTRALLATGISLQLAGPLVAVTIRALK